MEARRHRPLGVRHAVASWSSPQVLAWLLLRSKQEKPWEVSGQEAVSPKRVP
jgi:hypothetical protein